MTNLDLSPEGIDRAVEAQFWAVELTSDQNTITPNQLRALMESAARARRPCLWSEDSEGTWHSACGRTWVFTDDGPVENRVEFCQGCGGSVYMEGHADAEG